MVSRNFYSSILISKIGVKMNFGVITKNHTADPEIGFRTKSISKTFGCATAKPPAWALKLLFSFDD